MEVYYDVEWKFVNYGYSHDALLDHIIFCITGASSWILIMLNILNIVIYQDTGSLTPI